MLFKFINSKDLLENQILLIHLKDTKCYKNEYNMDIMRQSASLVVNPITMYSYGFISLIARRWAGLRLNDDPDVKL